MSMWYCFLGSRRNYFLGNSLVLDFNHLYVQLALIVITNTHLGTLSKKKTTLFGKFSQHGGGGLPKSQNFCKFTKYFFVCQIHSEVLKHVLQMGG